MGFSYRMSYSIPIYIWGSSLWTTIQYIYTSLTAINWDFLIGLASSSAILLGGGHEIMAQHHSLLPPLPLSLPLWKPKSFLRSFHPHLSHHHFPPLFHFFLVLFQISTSYGVPQHTAPHNGTFFMLNFSLHLFPTKFAKF